MLAKIIYFDCIMLVLDLVTIGDLRKFLLDFLKVKNNRKKADQVYSIQSLHEKITLTFIKAHQKKYIKEFNTFHKIYLAVIYTFVPQYVIIITANILLKMKSVYLLGFFAALKLLICLLVRMNVDSNRISIYRDK